MVAIVQWMAFVGFILSALALAMALAINLVYTCYMAYLPTRWSQSPALINHRTVQWMAFVGFIWVLWLSAARGAA